MSESELPACPDVIFAAFLGYGHWPNWSYADLVDRWAWVDPARPAPTDQRLRATVASCGACP